MSQRTLVVKVPAARHAAVRARLASGAFTFRPVPHAVFSAKGEGVVATLYRSGKLVVQGADPEAFLARWTDLDAPAAAPEPRPGDDPLDLEGPVTGSDEAGKGDYFGPLVVAAVRGDAETLAPLVEAGVTDSKALTDARALRLAALVRETAPHAVVRVDPPEYNERYATYPGLNPFLAELHAEALGALARPGEHVVVDQFERRGLVRRAVRDLGVELTEVPRAERHPAVAAASVLARSEFLLALRELSERCGVPLHKGAGAPTDRAGVEYARAHGLDALDRVAKLHFKNTGKIAARA